MTRLARDQHGFTLAELIVVIAILGVMLAGLVTVQMQGQQSYLIGSHRVEAQQNGRVALEMMIRELRSNPNGSRALLLPLARQSTESRNQRSPIL